MALQYSIRCGSCFIKKEEVEKGGGGWR